MWNHHKHSGSVLSLQARRQTQRQAVSSDRLVWYSLESTRPACTRVRTSLDCPGVAWTTCEKRSRHARPVSASHRRRSGPGVRWESSLPGWFLLPPCIILWPGGAADAHLWLASFCFWPLDWGHQPAWPTVLTGLMMWRVQRRVAVRHGATKRTESCILQVLVPTTHKWCPKWHSEAFICRVSCRVSSKGLLWIFCFTNAVFLYSACVLNLSCCNIT